MKRFQCDVEKGKFFLSDNNSEYQREFLPNENRPLITRGMNDLYKMFNGKLTFEERENKIRIARENRTKLHLQMMELKKKIEHQNDMEILFEGMITKD